MSHVVDEFISTCHLYQILREDYRRIYIGGVWNTVSVLLYKWRVKFSFWVSKDRETKLKGTNYWAGAFGENKNEKIDIRYRHSSLA